jgi:hypothetical protein
VRYSAQRFHGGDIVLGYRLSRDASVLARKAARSVGVGFHGTRLLSDILAVPCTLLICDFSGLGKEELGGHYESMCEVNVADSDFRWILLGGQALKPPKALHDRLLMPKRFDEQTLRLIILRQIGKVRGLRRKAHDYDRRLHRLLSSLKQLRTQKVVRTKDLCAAFDVNPRTVARDMILLNAIGEWNEYDPHTKAYKYLLNTPWPGGR